MEALILAGGKGTRLRPLTDRLPKAMIEIAGKPLLEHIINGLKENGISDLVIVVHFLKEKIINYFGNGSKFGVKIKYALQENFLGTGNAVGTADGKITSEKFLVVNGDQLLDFSIIKKMITERDCNGVILARKTKNPELYGVLKTEGKKVVKVVEKPKTFVSNLANAGVYIFPKEIFQAIKETELSPRGEYEITDSIQILINKSSNFHYVLYDGYWFDIGSKEDLEKANATFNK